MKKALYVVVCLSAGALLLAAPVGAAPYGPAGCGLGSMIFEPNSGFTQIFAATTNGTFGNQTFGISSGTSNCAPAGGGAKSAKAFVETNRNAIAKDVARGQGETIESLTRLAGCRDASAVGASLQRRFDQIFPNATLTDSEVGHNVVEALRSDATLSCQDLAQGSNPSRAEGHAS